jgi:putative ABC transport system permease protein
MAEWLKSLRHRLRALLQRRQLEQDLQDEVAFHLAMREEQLRTRGAVDAGRGARRRFGSVTRIREDLRDTWAVAPKASALLRDLRYATRTLRRDIGFATVVVLTLGLGIGANTAFFSVVNAVLIRPLGYADADRLVSLQEGFPHARVDRLPFSALDFDDLRRYQASFEAVAAYRNAPFEVSGNGTSEWIAGTKVSANLFGALGVGPVVGRTFLTADDRPGVNVAILSWGLWQRRYAANSAMLGQTIQLDRRPYTVVGIMPAGFVFPRRGPSFNGEPADVWVPIAFTDRERVERGTMHNNSVVARLKAGVSLQAAQAELDLLAPRVAASYPPAVISAGFAPGLFAQPLREDISGRFEAPLLMLMAAVGLVLLVACANVANLLLSRVTARTREFAVRTALGARRAQIVQLLLCEALLLSVAGGIVGMAIAYWAIKAAPAVLMRTIPGLYDLSIDVRVLAFTAVICLATTIIFALVPVPALEQRSPGDSLREDSSRTTSGFRKLQIQRGFVVLTVSLACVLLVSAGLFVRSLATLVGTDPGFRPARVLTASMALPRTFYTTAASIRTFHESLSRSLSSLPGVRTVTVATDLPFSAYDFRAFTPEGAIMPGDAAPTTSLTWMDGPYFETLGMTLERGRFFTADEYAQNRGVVIVNEKLAALAWPGQDPLGKRLKWGGATSFSPWLTVVAVIRNVADGPAGAKPQVHAYEPFRQIPDFFLDGGATQFGRDVKVALLAESDTRTLAPLVRQEISKLDRELAIESIQTMDQQVRDVVAPQRFSTLLVGAFAAMGLLLASVGLYGLLAYNTARRRKEIAVRMALGAERRAVVGMVVGQGARLVAMGLLIGLPGSLALTRVVASLLYQANPYELVTFAIIPAVLVPAALLACALPAWRAARVNPTTALRAE